ncbi:hypothetical protein DR864_29460 (plasmid) [Runella rosea]|uniref:Uncharacterized protein n=1 Tax=Runella rosea TaxID=2259595 RepID=A0A344TTM4_9BACT|nr:choice-of-anchor Q domain-containing protein [Runella rosea]AXE21995.1 hypothetical protein DR864_29460 [Runella rosea]
MKHKLLTIFLILSNLLPLHSQAQTVPEILYIRTVMNVQGCAGSETGDVAIIWSNALQNLTVTRTFYTNPNCEGEPALTNTFEVVPPGLITGAPLKITLPQGMRSCKFNVVSQASNVSVSSDCIPLTVTPAPTRLYVNATATGANTGLTWTDAFTDLQSALNYSCNSNLTEIWVAAGTYKPTSGTDRNAAFVMKNGVAIYGGFPNTGDPTLTDRNWNTNVTILSGEIGAAGIADNSYRVINNAFTLSSPLTNTAILDGFTLEAANANGAFPLNLGGGMWNANASPTIRNCTFRNNFAGAGACMFNDNSSLTATNCLFINNTCSISGAAISCGGGSANVKVINCTFYGNSGGTTIENQSNASYTNCIVWGNSGGINGGNVTYSIVQGGYTGTGNLNADPLFVNAASGDLRLQQCSQAIDAGTNTNAPSTDFAGNARPFNATGVSNADMGAYEYQSTYNVCACTNITGGIVYVNASASGSNNGSTWANAFTDLQAALTLASTYPSCVSQIWVAAGTYKPTTGTDRTISFVMKNGVAIYGGFPNSGNPTFADRNWVTNVTTLSGDIGTVGNNSDNSYNVINNDGKGLNTTAVLDGFTISGGNANHPSSQAQSMGGGINNTGSSPTIQNCLISDNSANFAGGGIVLLSTGSTKAQLTNCLFRNNTSSQGGAIFVQDASCMYVNCAFQNNNNTGQNNFIGTAILFNNTSTSGMSSQLINCSFRGNTGSTTLHKTGNNHVVELTNCVVSGNGLFTFWLDGTNEPILISYSLLESASNPTTYTATNSLTTSTSPFISPTSLALAACSPAINAGDPATTSATVGNVDLAGDPRFFNNGRVDMGAYEFQATLPNTVPGVWFVNASVSVSGSGRSWDCAFKDLQQALAAAGSGDQIWVAAGTYKPTSGTDRNAAFVMKNGVAIYGGFFGNETQLSQRNWNTNVTILSGEIGAAGIADNSYRVINNTFTASAPLASSAILDGFTVEAANANGGFPLNLGGGMWNTHASPTVSNCIFRNNTAAAGGAMFNDNSQASVTNCLFIGNSCTVAGAAMSNGGGTASARVTNCTFFGNIGGNSTISNEVNATAITNCIVWGNATGVSGGTVTYSIVQGGFTGTGNLNADPLFVNAAGGNLRLQACSPAIDAGSDAANTTTADLGGNPRKFESVLGGQMIDMGAYEFQATTPNTVPGVWFVNASVSVSGSGRSWDCAFKDLQQALAAAGSGDQIWVAAGTYKPTSSTDRTISFVMKNGVAIYGGFPNSGDPTFADRNWATNVTTLSGDIGTAGNSVDNSYHVIYNFDNGLDANAILDGFTISGGIANGQSNTINAFGGGVYNRNSSPAFYNCTFTGNLASGLGGGMFNQSSSPTVVNCNFTDNSANSSGGGMSNLQSSPNITNAIFTGNSASFGGGMYNSESSPNITNAIFTGNSASFGGGTYNAIAANPTFTNCTFTGNSGKEIYYGAGSPTFNNCIIWGQTDVSGNFTNCIIQGGYTGCANCPNGNGNADPLFINAAGGNFRLQACSPAIDAGSDAANTTTADLGGNPRKFESVSGGQMIDMGAYEFQATLPNTVPGVWFVNASVSVSGNGRSWDCAFKDLQQALAAAGSGDQIWVAAGTYKPTSGTNRSISFVMKNGVAIYGGFPNTGNPTLTDRNWATNETILSGDIGTVGDITDNCRNVIRNGNAINNTAVLDGFVVTGGNANTSGFSSGGGMYNNGIGGNCNPTVVNCVFKNNFARSGGAVANEGDQGSSQPTFTNCLFFENQATYNSSFSHGGAMWTSGNANVTITNCTFANNSALGDGGALFQASNLGSPTITLRNCIFWGNQAAVRGNQIRNGSASTLNISHTILEGGIAAISNGDNAIINDNGNNAAANPLFVNAAGGNFRLQACSPAINAGDPATTSATAGNVDLAGNPRFFNSGRVDMGAYEYQFAPPTALTPTVGSNNPITCGGNNGSITLSGFLNSTTYSVTYKKDNNDVAAANFTSSDGGVITLTGLGAGSYTHIVATYGACVSNAATATLNDPAKPSLTLSTIPAICAGAISFTIPYTNPTQSPNKYSISGVGITTVNDGDLTNPISVTLSTGASGSSISFTLTLSNTTTNCISEEIMGSVTVNPNSLGGTVGNTQTICSGTAPADLSLSNQVGNVVKWQKSSDAALSSPVDIVSTSTTLTSATIGNLTANTYFRAVVKSGVCAEAFSEAVLITVNPVSVGGTVSAAQTICSGTSPADLTLSGQTGSVVKWQKSSDAAFSSPVDIVSTETTLTSATIGNLTANTYFRALVKSGVCAEAFSEAVLITVNPVSVGGTLSAAQTICAGTAPADLSLSGQTGSVIKWQKSSDAAFTSPVDIVSTATTLTSATIGHLTTNTYFRALVKSGVCAEAFSEAVLITVNPVSAGGTVGSAQTICSSTAPVDLSLSGQTGNVVKWQKSTDMAFSSPVDIVSTSTTLTSVTIGNLTTNTYFRAVVKSGVCAEAFSEAVLITVNPVSAGGTVGSAQTICSSTAPVDLSLSGQTGNVVKWQKSTDMAFSSPVDIVSTSTTLTSVTIGNLTTNTYFRAVVKSGVCAEAFSEAVLITVNPVSAGGTLSAAQTICSGTAPADLSLSGQTGSLIKWQKSTDMAFSSPVDIVSTETTLTSATIGNLTVNTYFRALVKSGVCAEAFSEAVLITVNPVSVGGTVSAAQTICAGTAPADLSLSGQTGSVVKWQKSSDEAFTSPVDIVSTATTLTSATIGNLTANTYFRALVKSGVCSKAFSEAVLITILSPAVPTVQNDTIVIPNLPFSLRASGCSGPNAAVNWYLSSDNSPVAMPATILSAASFYARCQQSSSPVTCLSDPSANVFVKVVKQIFVNQANKAVIRNGKSWTTAFSDLKMGLDTAALAYDVPVEVWVAKGTYKPGTLRRDVFTIPSGVKVYGGFEGNETLLSQQNPKNHLTILSGEIGGTQRNDNSNHVVLFRSTDSLTRLDGFRIEKGFAEFVGITQDTDLNDPAVLASGGGILAINKSKGLITNCIITDNRAVGGGGMMLRDSSHMRITQSIIFGNEATFGGAVYVLGGSRPYFENVLMVINKGLGGGLYVNGSQPLLVNTTIASNKDDGKNAGGIYNANSVTTVKNSILWGNSPLQSTLGSNITYSTVEGGYTGVGNSNQNPQFVNPNANGLAPMGTLGDYHLLPCSPAINGGDNSVAPNVDLEGNLRPYPVGLGIVDRGVYESQSSGSSGPANLTVTENITSGTVLKAADKIVATNQVSGATVVYQATKSVTLNPGFSATAGAGNSFLAYIGGCP